MKRSPPLIIAHRGDSSNFPENSLAGMKSAVDLKVDMLETDIRLTKDNELVIFHDESIDRVSNGKGKLIESTLDELKQFKLTDNLNSSNNQEHKILTLTELFESFPSVKINIDIKNQESIAVSKLVEIIKEEKNASERIIVSSFHDQQIINFRKKLPNIKTGASPLEIKKFIILMKFKLLFSFKSNFYSFQVPMYHESTKIITPSFIKQAQKKNIRTMVWTINDVDTMNYLIQLGVDGIFTDYPSMLIKLLQEKSLD